MNIRSVFLLTLSTLVLFISSCSNRPEITEQNVSRIISTLSSDEMQGRHAMSPEIDMAADFIAKEFSKIGLTPFDEDFKQTFTLYSIIPSQSSVSVNGNELEEHKFFSITNTDSVRWSLTDVTVETINESEDFREALNTYRNDDRSSIITVSEAHSEWFSRYRGYYSRANRTLDIDQKPNDLFVLTNDRVRSANV